MLRRRRRQLVMAAYRQPAIRRIVDRRGPAFWRLPRQLRRGLVSDRCHAKRADEFVVVRPRRSWSPAGVGSREHPQLRVLDRRATIAPLTIAEYRHVWLVGPFATPVLSDGRVLLSPYRDQPGKLIGTENAEVIDFVRSRRYEQWPDDAVPKLFSMVGRLSSNYYHWVVEHCAQLEALSAYERRTDIRVPLLMDAQGPPFQGEWLDALGWRQAERRPWPRCGAVAVESLCVASIPGLRFAADPSSIAWLRTRVPAPTSMGRARRLLVLRPDGAWRSITNGPEVARALAPLGFETIRPEIMTVQDQLDAFAQAEIVVGQHGAGLANCIFQESGSVVEIFGSYGGPEFAAIAAARGLRYVPIAADPVGDDVRVDPRHLGAAVRSAIAA